MSICLGADFDKAKMDSLFSIIESHQKGMGSIFIFENGTEVYQHSFGHVDVNSNLIATADTKYRIGSISKLFTAKIIIQLVEEGLISMDTPLSDFFPDLKNVDKIPSTTCYGTGQDYSTLPVHPITWKGWRNPSQEKK